MTDGERDRKIVWTSEKVQDVGLVVVLLVPQVACEKTHGANPHLVQSEFSAAQSATTLAHSVMN